MSAQDAAQADVRARVPGDLMSCSIHSPALTPLARIGSQSANSKKSRISASYVARIAVVI